MLLHTDYAHFNAGIIGAPLMDAENLLVLLFWHVFRVVKYSWCFISALFLYVLEVDPYIIIGFHRNPLSLKL